MKRTFVTLITAGAVAVAPLVGSAAAAPAHAAPPSSAGASPYFLYAHGFLSTGLSAFRATDRGPVRPTRGAVSGFASWPKAVSPDGKQLIVVGGAPAVIRAYAIAPNETLRLQKSRALASDTPVDIQFAPNSRRMYLTQGSNSAFVQAYHLAPNGAITAIGGRAPLGEATDSMITSTVSVDGKNLYVASWLRGELTRRAILPNGTLGPVRQRITTGIQPLFPRVTPNGKHLLVVSELGARCTATTLRATATSSRRPAVRSPLAYCRTCRRSRPTAGTTTSPTRDRRT